MNTLNGFQVVAKMARARRRLERKAQAQDAVDESRSVQFGGLLVMVLGFVALAFMSGLAADALSGIGFMADLARWIRGRA